MMKNPKPWFKQTVEFGPLLIFFVVYQLEGIWIATGTLMATTLIAIAVLYWAERRVSMFLVVTAAFVMVFGGLTLIFDDDRFIKMKPTVVQGLFSVILLGGLAMGKSLLKPVMRMAWELTDRGWSLLSLRFGLFFAGMAILNEIVWRTQSTDIWVDYKVFGAFAVTTIFIMPQIPLLMRYQVLPEEDEPEKEGD